MSKDGKECKNILINVQSTSHNSLVNQEEKINNDERDFSLTQKLDLIPNGILEAKFVIDRIIKNDHSLKEGNFSKMNLPKIEDSSFLLGMLAVAMINNDNLETLNLSNIEMNIGCIEKVIDILRVSPNIKSLILEKCDINQRAVEPLFKFLKEEIPKENLSLKNLSLNDNRLGRNEVMIIHHFSKVIRNDLLTQEESILINEERSIMINEEDNYLEKFDEYFSSPLSTPIDSPKTPKPSINHSIPSNRDPSNSPESPKAHSVGCCTKSGCVIS
jgi:hypothetical protein